MIYIDKSIKAQEGWNINIRFLKEIFDPISLNFTIPLDKSAYEKYVRSFSESSIWRKLLCEEQDYLCCYCMRRLTFNNGLGMSVEHIIPQSLRGIDDKAEFDRYISGPNSAPNLVRFVEYSENVESAGYSSENDIDRLPKMPHVIAHHNLVAACRGISGSKESGCCCNSVRKRNYIVPYMLIVDGYKHFKYDPNGLVSIDVADKSWEKILKELNSTTFQNIRYIWYKIARNTNYKSCNLRQNADVVQRMYIFRAAFNINNFYDIPKKYQAFAGKIVDSGNDYLWQLLLEYNSFLDYYRKNK